MLKIYLDTCCYNRPFDDQEDDVIHAETEAKIYIQSLVKFGVISLVCSVILSDEIEANPNPYNKSSIKDFVTSFACEYIGIEQREKIRELSEEIVNTGVKPIDAAHVACAILSNCDYFITTDKRILKYKTDKIKLVNPLFFLTNGEKL
jgi:predicted nucleic acid-binding protein